MNAVKNIIVQDDIINNNNSVGNVSRVGTVSQTNLFPSVDTSINALNISYGSRFLYNDASIHQYSTEKHFNNLTYHYYGFTDSNGVWFINRFAVSNGSISTGQDSNNTPGTYADLSAAWVDVLTLTYT